MKLKIGERLRLLVKEKGKEQQEVAVELGLKVPTFNGYVSNQREPSIEKMVQFAEYFDVTVDYLTGKTDIRNPYLSHLTENLSSFVREPENAYYLELAMDIKERAKSAGKKQVADNEK